MVSMFMAFPPSEEEEEDMVVMLLLQEARSRSRQEVLCWLLVVASLVWALLGVWAFVGQACCYWLRVLLGIVQRRTE
jgi:hypothetical protein